MNWCDELWPAGHILIKLVCGSNWAKIRTAAAASAHAKENYSIASHMRFHHLIVIQTFLCQPKFLPCVKTIFQIQTQPTKVYKLTKLNSRIYRSWSWEIVTFDWIFLYCVDGQDSTSSLIKKGTGEHTWSHHFSLTAFFNWEYSRNFSSKLTFGKKLENSHDVFNSKAVNRETNGEDFSFSLKNDDTTVGDEELWSSEIHNKQMLVHKSKALLNHHHHF